MSVDADDLYNTLADENISLSDKSAIVATFKAEVKRSFIQVSFR